VKRLLGSYEIALSIEFVAAAHYSARFGDCMPGIASRYDCAFTAMEKSAAADDFHILPAMWPE